MPAWCAYRDAARTERVATETAAVAAELPPQGPEYRDAPLKVVGEHDEGTVAQMLNCMAVGNVLAGVICADGHLGYAQPVGGVIAYEKQISISGVGFDIGCGNMAVRLDTPFLAIEDKVGAIIKDVARVISFGIGRTNEERVEHELFDDADAWTSSGDKLTMPVTFAPGRLRLVTSPDATGSPPTVKTTGMVLVAALAASAAASPLAAITATRRRTRSAASAGSRSNWFSA